MWQSLVPSAGRRFENMFSLFLLYNYLSKFGLHQQRYLRRRCGLLLIHGQLAFPISWPRVMRTRLLATGFAGCPTQWKTWWRLSARWKLIPTPPFGLWAKWPAHSSIGSAINTGSQGSKSLQLTI